MPGPRGNSSSSGASRDCDGDGWFLVQAMDGAEGYVKAARLYASPDGVKASCLRRTGLHSRPCEDSTKLSAVVRGDVVNVLKRLSGGRVRRRRSRSRSRTPPRHRHDRRDRDSHRNRAASKSRTPPRHRYDRRDRDSHRNRAASKSRTPPRHRYGRDDKDGAQCETRRDSYRDSFRHHHREEQDNCVLRRRPEDQRPQAHHRRSSGPMSEQDPNLPLKDDDPRRGEKPDPRRKGMNTASFDPASTLVRPGMRIRLGPQSRQYPRPLSHDDVVMAPDLFCEADDHTIYYKLVEEIRSLQDKNAAAEWEPWHEGCHLITKNPDRSPTYQKILDRMCEYFKVQRGSAGTRFNWYRDGTDWKPLHHDSAAFNAGRAKRQNITIGVSFGAERELCFKHARDGTLMYFPQTNGMVFSFGRDVNILWKHGINALAPDKQTGQGRISIILWGWCELCYDEPGSPPMVQNGSSLPGDRNPTTLCRDFMYGNCKYGARCRFVHPQGSTQGYDQRGPQARPIPMMVRAP
eukprot:TRINITY_DN379_c0_g1_i2.p2 TRINITY_DN379_c0_g1~~TRINITY_DN379_c0_g1_i2.p2  ORF type:complete len:518 (+),score=126.58 TRINITY_DN379_c0_g1_i2:68-1621(+)